MTILQIIAQVIAVFILILLVTGAQSKTQKQFLFFQLLINSLYIVHFVLLGAYTAALVSAVCVVRTLIFYVYKQVGKSVPVGLLIAVFAAVIASAVWTWDGWLSILPVIAAILCTYAQWQRSIRLTRVLVSIEGVIGITYDLFYLAFVDAIGKSIEVISYFVAMIRYRKNKTSPETEKNSMHAH